ncbi:hypothetical protein ACH4UI_33640 [Streptomyces griseochromogenes]|uniref:hypothetical protein n=1 Tax=Streptomyces griseochromogenes TaxID=68214 RepID=UPI00379E7549
MTGPASAEGRASAAPTGPASAGVRRSAASTRRAFAEGRSSAEATRPASAEGRWLAEATGRSTSGRLRSCTPNWQSARRPQRSAAVPRAAPKPRCT